MWSGRSARSGGPLRILGQCCYVPRPTKSHCPSLQDPSYPHRLLLCDFCSEWARLSHCPRVGSCLALPGLQRWALGTTSPSPLLPSTDECSSLCTSLLLLPQMVAGVSLWLLLLGPAAGGLCSNTGSAGLAQWENKGPLAGDLSLFSPVSFSNAFISSE